MQARPYAKPTGKIRIYVPTIADYEAWQIGFWERPIMQIEMIYSDGSGNFWLCCNSILRET